MRRLHASLTVAAIAVVAVTASACTSSGRGASHSSAANSGSGGAAASGAALSARMRTAAQAITSAQVSVDATIVGQKITGSGPATFASGELTAVDLKGDVPAFGGNVRLLLTGGQAYAQLPKSLNPSGKPWLAVTSSSSNASVAQLASIIGEVESAASLDDIAELVSADAAPADKGTETIDGAPATHYAVLADASKLPASFPDRSDLAGQLKNTPTDLWVDAQARPVKISRPVLILGTKVIVTIGLGAFNQPVSITAPPSGDVAGN